MSSLVKFGRELLLGARSYVRGRQLFRCREVNVVGSQSSAELRGGDIAIEGEGKVNLVAEGTGRGRGGKESSFLVQVSLSEPDARVRKAPTSLSPLLLIRQKPRGL